MASKRKGFPRRAGTAIRKHSLQRLLLYVGNKRGFSLRVARQILLACREVAQKESVTEVPINEETLLKTRRGRRCVKYLRINKIKEGIKAMFAPDGSVSNIFQDE
ncbi:MAG TPA: hypothetical protein ENJ27_02190 [Candidatus Moranbacteria bacterium]|nr:hypothetical protein [Candidatus Moranbacteria bacterium]